MLANRAKEVPGDQVALADAPNGTKKNVGRAAVFAERESVCGRDRFVRINGGAVAA